MEGEAAVVAGRGAGERGFDRLSRAREDGEDAVAEELAFDGGAGVLADDGAERGVEVAGLRAEGGVAEALGEGGGVDDVGEEDGGCQAAVPEGSWSRLLAGQPAADQAGTEVLPSPPGRTSPGATRRPG